MALTPISMALSPELIAAYRAAEYAVFDAALAIRIGEANPALDRLIERSGGAAFLSGANPASEHRSEAENRLSHRKLEQAVTESGYTHVPGEGRDPNGHWPAEPSLLVLGIARADAAKLAREFAQNAFVWCEPGKPPELVVVAKWRIVLDTHVWLDWLAFDDASVAPLKVAHAEERIEIFMDPACEAELERVLAYPIGRKVAEKSLQAARLAEARRLSKSPNNRTLSEADRASLPRCRDRDDQKFLELALAARAHVLVTKDRALLELARRTPFRIVPPADATQLFASG